MMDSVKLEVVRKKCGFANGISVDSNGNSGGLGFWWRDHNVNLKSFFPHHICVEIDSEYDSSRWMVCGIYGWPERANKYKTWDLMRSLVSNVQLPYVFFGDFNEIMSTAEKEGGSIRDDRDITAFHNCVDDCSLVDLGYRGNCFTWCRGKSQATFIRERMDRFLASSEWVELFPCPDLRHFPIFKSDHAPIMLCSESRRTEDINEKLFRFESFWLSRDGVNSVVEEAWNNGLIFPIHTLVEKSLRAAVILGVWAAVLSRSP